MRYDVVESISFLQSVSSFSLTDLEEEMQFAWAVFLLVLLFASTMDASRRDGIRKWSNDSGKNKCTCTPCKGKLKMRESPSVRPEPLPLRKCIRHSVDNKERDTIRF